MTADPKLQLSLAFRICLYWLACLLTVAVLYGTRLAIQEFPMNVEEMCSKTWEQIGPALLTSLFFMPLMLVDVLFASNKFAGPMVQIRRSLKTLANGESLPDEVVLRKGDFYPTIAEDLNRLNRRLLGLKAANSESSESEKPETPLPTPERDEGALEMAAAAS